MIGQGIAGGYGNINMATVGIAALGGAVSGALLGGAINGFRYVKAASFLKANGITDVKGVMTSFKGTPKLKKLRSNSTVYRTWGGDSPKFSHWVSPKNYGAAAKNMLALPIGNTMTNISNFIISKGTVVLQGKAAGLFGQLGGGIQWWVAFLS